MTRTWAYPSRPTMTSYRGEPVNQNVTIYSDDSLMGVPTPTLLRHIGGVPDNHNVTIYSDDSCMGDELPAYYM